MTPELYKQLAADLRGHMENPDRFKDQFIRYAHREPPLLPGAEKRSVVPEPLPPGPDLSALNPKTWKAGQRGGRKNGRRKKR